MASDPNGVHVVTADEIYMLLKQHERRAGQRHWFITGGLALVFSTLVPGLGLLFLRRYGWALVYFLACGFLILWGNGAWIAAVIIWLINIIHAGGAAAAAADAVEAE